MNTCVECYSEYPRITPLLNGKDCLENHEQYICGTCGRCICIGKDEKRGLQRWNFPFKSLEIAVLYLRTADVTEGKNCGIYEIVSKTGRKSYKVFPSVEDLKKYLLKNKDKSCDLLQPIFQQKEYKEFSNTQIRKLNEEEVNKYLSEQK
ncbi:MAG TPA: hypothetical protein GX708_22595 [Gallicola sp.]|nr:hypothetical protein [Gallicola sp.]